MKPHTPYLATRANRLGRRQFLRGFGVSLALPMLEAMTPAFAAKSDIVKPRRLFAICNNLGVLPGEFFPAESGRDYKLSPYLIELAAYRDDFTVFSGVSHPSVDGSHASDVSFLTAAAHPGGGGFRNSISLDQFVASKVGHLTRFPSLTLGVNAKAGSRSLSWTDSGVLIPCTNNASDVYRQLFLQGSPTEVARQVKKLELGQSIMDTLADQSRSLQGRLSASDRDRLDQYFTSVREVEKRMAASRDWEQKPKPKPSAPMPEDPDDSSAYMEKTRLMYQMARLAFETDSTRSVTLLLDSTNSPTIEVKGAEISDGYHNLSHHGKSESKLKQLQAIDREHMRLIGNLLGDLKSVREADETLLDRTMVLYGSNFGDANKHTTDNMPILLAGGGFQHGQHLAFDRDDNYPLPNLFVSMLEQMNLDVERFASSTGSMRGLS
jgi:hypothetical protein